MKTAIVVSASQPILVLTSCATLASPEFAESLRVKGIGKFIAYEVDLERCRQLYDHHFRHASARLRGDCTLGVLDFDGHRILLNFSLSELGQPLVVDEVQPVTA
jgi:hypothetical protein